MAMRNLMPRTEILSWKVPPLSASLSRLAWGEYTATGAINARACKSKAKAQAVEAAEFLDLQLMAIVSIDAVDVTWPQQFQEKGPLTILTSRRQPYRSNRSTPPPMTTYLA